MGTGRVVAGRYRLDRLIGSGGMASVYSALDESLGRTVAVKIFSGDLANAGDERRQAEEVSLLASLNHPALVTLFDAGRDADTAYIVMEHVDGADLRARLESGPLSPREVADVGADIAAALAHIHERGVVHRDVKPANLLLPARAGAGGAPRAKLADFGIARLIDSTRLTATGGVIGTASFLSPEQARGEAVSAPSDVYSLGLVLLEALTGLRAFPGTAVESTVARLARDPDIPTALGPEWVALLSAATAREPGARPAAEELSERLRALGKTGPAVLDLGRPSSIAADPDLPTEALGQATALTEPLPREGDPTKLLPAATARRRPSRRVVLLSAAVPVALAAIAVIVVLTIPAQNEPPATVEYPAVEGTLGEHLSELQRSVQP